MEYRKTDNRTTMELLGAKLIPNTTQQTHPIRVIHRSKGQFLGYNPRQPLPIDASIWLPNPYRIENM